MGKWEQDSAQEIAAALHDVERAYKKLGIKIERLHGVLGEKAKEHCEALGIDVQPLSGGTPKPPRD